MNGRNWLGALIAALLAAPSCVRAAQLGATQVQAAVADAAGVMDGSMQRAGLSVASSGAAKADEGALAKSLAAAKAGMAAQPKGARIDGVAVPAPKPDLRQDAKKHLQGVYKWMVRNPVEASFIVAIPVTMVAGFQAGAIAGTAFYYFLQSRQKKPF